MANYLYLCLSISNIFFPTDMENFTIKEKAALVGILCAIVYADGFIDPAEVNYMGRIGYELGFSDDVIGLGLEMEAEEALSIISAMGHEKKCLAGKAMMKMVYIDGKELDATEYQLVTGIFLRCGISPDDIQQD